MSGARIPTAVAASALCAAVLSPLPSSATAPAVSTTQVERSIHGRFESANEWRGTVEVDQAVVRQGRTQLRRTGEISFSVWRRVCDIGGCIESVVSAQRAPLDDSAWALDLSRGWAKSTRASVSVTRYRVDREQLAVIDARTVTAPVVVSMVRVKDSFDQTLTARGQGVTTASRTQQVSANVTLSIDTFRLTTDIGSAVLTNILTTMSAPAPRKARQSR